MTRRGRPCIHRASDAEAYACRLLLPEAFSLGAAPVLLVATPADIPGQIIASAALTWEEFGADPGFGLQLHVVPSARRQGVGRALIEAAAQLCQGETSALRTSRPLPDGSEAEPFLEATGFVQGRRMRHFEAGLQHYHAIVDSFYQRLASHGQIPTDARVVSAREVPAGPLATLLASEFPVQRETARRWLSGEATDGYDLDASVVLMVEGEIAGALFIRFNGTTPTLDALVIRKRFRKSWANVVLLREATFRGLEIGRGHGWSMDLQKIRFSCDQDNHDTLRLAARGEATALRSETSWRLAITIPAA